MAEAVRDAVAQLETDIGNLRALITDLRPAALDELGTNAAIEDLADRARGHGLHVELTIDLAYEHGRAPDRHTPELETAIYRIVQEALTNAQKHGGARGMTIQVQEDQASVHVTVQDDGRGFDTTAQTRGFGLIGMHERADLLGGTLNIQSTPGNGTTVTAAFPARRRSREQAA